MKKITDYLKGVIAELKKVKWPTRNEAVRLTIIVIILVAIFAIFIGILDVIFTFVLQKIIG